MGINIAGLQKGQPGLVHCKEEEQPTSFFNSAVKIAHTIMIKEQNTAV